MGIIGFRTAVGLAAMAALAACGGSSDNGSGGGSADDFFNTPDLADSDAGTIFLENLTGFVETIEVGAVATSIVDEGAPLTGVQIPTSGNVAFSGTSIIVDVNLPDDVTTLEEARPYLILTGKSSASIDLDNGDIAVSLTDFVDIDDNTVLGSVDMPAGQFTAGLGIFSGPASGTVDGTTIEGQMNGFIYGSNSAAEGAFGALSRSDGEDGGIVGEDGPWAGVEIGGAFAAD